MASSIIYQEGGWRIHHDSQDQITVQHRTLGIWTTWTEPVGHDTWLPVTFPDYEAAIAFIQRML